MALDNTFMGLPVEIRLLIYSDLLVLQDPISFVEELFTSPPALRRAWSRGLYPSILQVNKRVFSEANSLLYTDNRFRFVDLWLWPYSGVARVDLTPFFLGISLQASSLRYICVNFPSFKQSYFEPGDIVKIDDVDINNLEAIQASCTGLITIEFILCFAADVPYMTGQDNRADPLAALELLLNGIPTLKRVIVNAHNSKNIHMRDENDAEDGYSGIWNRMIEYGWTVNVRDPPKRMWIRSDDMVDFDTESDYNHYERKLVTREFRRLENEMDDR
ncbi:hypothetical protein PG990_014653 [Apiospora arundinis]